MGGLLLRFTIKSVYVSCVCGVHISWFYYFIYLFIIYLFIYLFFQLLIGLVTIDDQDLVYNSYLDKNQISNIIFNKYQTKGTAKSPNRIKLHELSFFFPDFSLHKLHHTFQQGEKKKGERRKREQGKCLPCWRHAVHAQAGRQTGWIRPSPIQSSTLEKTQAC